MNTAHMSRSSMIKVILALVVVATIAWQVPFSTFAEGEGDIAGAKMVADEGGGSGPAEGKGDADSGDSNPSDPNATTLSVTCSVSPAHPQINSPVTWSAQASGGNPNNYWYTWTGTHNFPGPQHTDGQQSVVAYYAHAGPNRRATVTVRSQGHEASATCETEIFDDNPPPPPPACSEPAQDWEIRAIGDQMQTSFNLDDGTASVYNPTNCDYPFALMSFKVTDTDPNTPQIHFDTDRQVVPAGQTRNFQVDLPQCRYQLDLVIFPDTPYRPSKLLRGDIKMGLNLCQPTGEVCPGFNPRTDLVDAAGNPFSLNPNDPPIIADNGSQAWVTVRNRSTACSYNVALTSYKTGEWTGDAQAFINSQTLFDSDIRGPSNKLGPGESYEFRVSVPSCNWQTDLYAFEDGQLPNPVPPDFGALTSTHPLLDWLQDLNNGACGDIPQCPAQPQITSPNPSGTFTVNQQFSYTVTTVGGTPPITVTIAPIGPAAPGLVINGNTISGTLTTAGTYSYEVTARGADSTGPDCADRLVFTITVTGGICPVAPPVITSPLTASGTVGVPFTPYTVTATGGQPMNISAGSLPPGLTFNAANNTITGTPTQAGNFIAILTAVNQCGNDVRNLVITIGDNQCPVTPPTITSPQSASGTVGVAFTPYTITTTGTVTSLTVSNTLPPGLTFNPTTRTISGTPTAAGTYIAIITASNQCGSTAINLTITIGGGQCPVDPPTITSPQSASGTVGVAFPTYTVTTTGTVSSITVANLPAGLTFNPLNNTITGTPEQAGTFTSIITASNQCGSTAINLTITISERGCVSNCGDDDDDGGGGGGRRRRPNVVLFTEPEVAGASISLAQVPYTGLGTSLLQIFLFLVGLLAISAGIVYGIMRKLRRSAEAVPAAHHYTEIPPVRKIAAEGYDTMSLELDTNTYEEYAHSVPAPARKETFAPATPRRAPSMTVAQSAPAVPAYTAPAALERVSQPSVATTTVANTPARMHSAPLEQAPEAKVEPARLQVEARGSRTLVSDDGATLIANSAEGDERKALERLAQVIEIAKTRYPREDGWIILDKERVRESLFISTLSMIPLFVEWVVRAEDKKVFTFLRMLKHQEQPVADFMRKVVSELDSAHRARLEGAEERAHVNAHIAEVTYHLSNKELEAIVAELLHGVDERYDSAYTSVRLSLVRVLDMIKERMLRAVGTAYAFTGERENV